MELYERVPIEYVNGLTFARGLTAFIAVCLLSAFVWWVTERGKKIALQENNPNVADANDDNYIDKIEDFQDDFR